MYLDIWWMISNSHWENKNNLFEKKKDNKYILTTLQYTQMYVVQLQAAIHSITLISCHMLQKLNYIHQNLKVGFSSKFCTV
jgi:hypothetical protein